jgi:signal transduction histidine kinase/ActR/RegA family two-component response regulator
MAPWDPSSLAILPILGVLVYAAAQELALVRGRDRHIHQWIFVWLLVSTVAVVGRLVQLRGTEASEIVLGVRLQYGAALALAALVVPAVHAADERPTPSRIAWFAGVGLLACLGLVFGTDLVVTPDLRTVTNLFGEPHRTAGTGRALAVPLLYVAALVALFVHRLRRWRTGAPGRGRAWRVLAVIFLGLGINDVLFQLGLIRSLPLFHFSFVALALAIGYVLRARLHHLYTNLQAAVAERTEQLEEALEEARSTRRQLLVADRLASVGTLAAGTAHEINNPLTYASTNLQLLDEALEAPEDLRRGELRELVAEAREGTDRIQRIVEDLRTFSPTREEGPEERVPVDLPALLDRCISMTGNEIRHRATLHRDYGACPPALGDPRRLGQVFINLLVNAAHALPTGEADRARIDVRIARAEEADTCVVEVRDSGAGMPAEIQDRIFEPFFTTKDPGEGTGLGLAVCHGIVTALGGRIEVDSAEGSGTTMRVLLPAATPDRISAQALSSPRAHATALSARVLLVDDEPTLARALRRALRAQDVTVAHDGARALELLDERPFDLVLCDVMMPVLGGAELFARLHAEDPDQADRVVFMSGGVFGERAVRLQREMPERFIHKPLDLDELRRRAAEAAARPLRPRESAPVEA